ncbi:MAG TPA: glycerophosphodiester phosphodiesterase, partial [Verrucomicrobiae bacterium]|nr:glycerophosphodiester phosphodiesterase [Verrucomicrobiae bacterium]
MKIIGHRGARGLAPENTIASLQKGLEHHADMLEFDLRVTKDHVVILHHDPYLTDPNGKKIIIKDTTYAELLEHKADIPTFEEVLDKVGHPVRLYVEVKPEAETKPIIKIFKARLAKGWKPEYFYLASFSQKILLELDKDLPEVQKVVIENWSGVRAHWRARQLHTKTVCMNERWLWSGFIKSVQ